MNKMYDYCDLCGKYIHFEATDFFTISDCAELSVCQECSAVIRERDKKRVDNFIESFQNEKIT